MAPRKISSKKSPVKKSSTSVKKSASSMVKVTPKKTMMQKHGKKLAVLAGLLAATGLGAAGEYKYRKNLTYGGQGPTRLEALKSMMKRK